MNEQYNPTQHPCMTSFLLSPENSMHRIVISKHKRYQKKNFLNSMYVRLVPLVEHLSVYSTGLLPPLG